MALVSPIKGLDGVLRKMKGLPVKLQRGALNKSLRKGGNVVKRAAVEAAKRFDDPNTPKKVWKEIVIRTNSRLGKKNGGAAIQIGVKGGAKRYVRNKENRRRGRVGQRYEGGGNVYYWRFLEFGTEKMRAQRFMTPALSDHTEQVIDATVKELTNQIDQAVKGL